MRDEAWQIGQFIRGNRQFNIVQPPEYLANNNSYFHARQSLPNTAMDPGTER